MAREMVHETWEETFLAKLARVVCATLAEIQCETLECETQVCATLVCENRAQGKEIANKTIVVLTFLVMVLIVGEVTLAAVVLLLNIVNEIIPDPVSLVEHNNTIIIIEPPSLLTCAN